MVMSDYFKGFASDYIKSVLIPSLPNPDHMIDYTKSILDYLQDCSNLRYVRKFKEYKLRGEVYKLHKTFTVTDNEPALWCYMECKTGNPKKFVFHEKENLFPIGWILDSDKNFLNRKFSKGRGVRENSFSLLGFKHCHILQCSPRNVGLDKLSLDQRMLRLLSPLNHFPFPNPNKFNMPYDYGEDSSFITLLIDHLINDFYKSHEQKKFFLYFLETSGGILNTNINNKMLLNFKKATNSTKNNVVNFNNYQITVNKTRFYIDETIYQKILKNPSFDFKLNVLPKKGRHPKGFYLIKNNIIKSFIEGKRLGNNWKLYKCFHQDGVPKKLKEYFNYLD